MNSGQKKMCREEPLVDFSAFDGLWREDMARKTL